MREFNYNIMGIIKERWSPRAFSNEKVNDEDLNAILEAARYAPSCFNEQPWRFVIGKDESLAEMQSFLTEKNLKWAKEAPVLILIMAKKTFDHNGKENKYAKFDTGTSWGFLSLEARHRGYHTHAMAGFSKRKVIEALELSEEYEPIAMVALGKYGDKETLDDMFKEKERPNTRLPLNQVSYTLEGWKKK